MKELILPSGHRVKLDDDEYDNVIHLIWRIRFSYNDMSHEKILVEAPVKNKKGRSTHILLHRLVMDNPPRDYAVKFKDGDRLNIQKSNLYLVRFYTLQNKRKKWLREQAKPKNRPLHAGGKRGRIR